MRDSLGRFIKGSKIGQEFRFKKGEHKSINTEFKKGTIENEKHPGWKGDKVGYHGIHKWLTRKLGQPKKCDECGEKDSTKRFEWANISGLYKRDFSDWKRLCKKCHNNFDNITVRGWETRRRVAQLGSI